MILQSPAARVHKAGYQQNMFPLSLTRHPPTFLSSLLIQLCAFEMYLINQIIRRSPPSCCRSLCECDPVNTINQTTLGLDFIYSLMIIVVTICCAGVHQTVFDQSVIMLIERLSVSSGGEGFTAGQDLDCVCGLRET